MEIVGECADGFKAVLAIEEHEPDLVFLDVQMPGLDGFGVLEMCGPRQPRAVVFVTAYDQYAVKAFDVHALDYILKPFGKERIREALTRAKEKLSRRSVDEMGDRLHTLLRQMEDARTTYPDWLLVKGEGKSYFVKISEVDWVESSRNNVKLHVGAAVHTLHETTANIERRLDPRRFLRVHRSTIVNIERIKDLQPWFNGEYVLTLRDGTELTMSATYKEKLKEFRSGRG